MRLSAALIAALAFLTASPTLAQTYVRPLPGGQTVTLPTTPAGCEKTNDRDRPAVSLQFRSPAPPDLKLARERPERLRET